MVDRRRHRSADPADREAFAPQALPRLREAVADLSWLAGRGYLERSAVGLVGDRYALTRRQREAVIRCACPREQIEALSARRMELGELRDRPLVIDGFNLLVTLEAALGGAVVLLARDGCARDVRGVRGTWRRTAETAAAIEGVGGLLAAAGPRATTWVLDHGVSNVGRLRALLLDAARRAAWPWSVEVRDDADELLAAAQAVVASADREVLARCGAWISLAAETVRARAPGAWLVDLS